jgi:hypothetical protein
MLYIIAVVACAVIARPKAVYYKLAVLGALTWLAGDWLATSGHTYAILEHAGGGLRWVDHDPLHVALALAALVTFRVVPFVLAAQGVRRSRREKRDERQFAFLLRSQSQARSTAAVRQLSRRSTGTERVSRLGVR